MNKEQVVLAGGLLFCLFLTMTIPAVTSAPSVERGNLALPARAPAPQSAVASATPAPAPQAGPQAVPQPQRAPVAPGVPTAPHSTTAMPSTMLLVLLLPVIAVTVGLLVSVLAHHPSAQPRNEHFCHRPSLVKGAQS